ncbi:MAG: hypothetical protein KIS87_05145 [Phycisphaeraceae bacterium]|nr:hypothetical protein [Phycisphaeraceae bacterium]
MKARTAGMHAALLSLALGAAACNTVHHTSYPSSLGVAATPDENPNGATMAALMAAAARWSVEHYPPPTAEYALNLPAGLKREWYLATVEAAGPNARALTDETAHLPTYHIGRIWIRSDRAKVDVTRPVFTLGETTSPLDQTTTVWLRRTGWTSWRVEHTQPWAIGVVPTPEPYYLPPEPQRHQRAQRTPRSTESLRERPSSEGEAEPADSMTEMHTLAPPASPVWLPAVADPYSDNVLYLDSPPITVQPSPAASARRQRTALSASDALGETIRDPRTSKQADASPARD